MTKTDNAKLVLTDPFRSSLGANEGDGPSSGGHRSRRAAPSHSKLLPPLADESRPLMERLQETPRHGVGGIPAGREVGARKSSLELVDRLVQELNEAGIRYCHWKSNFHLDVSLAGKDDLDILISIDDKLKAETIFSKLGFKHFIQVPTKRFNGITDIIGFDETSGRLVHLHTHYRLTLGQNRLEGYRLPWEHTVLKRVAPAYGRAPILLPSPEAELLLLVIRTCLKVRLWDRIAPGQLERTLRKKFEPERAWLQGQIDERRFCDLNAKWLDADLWPKVRSVALSRPDSREILNLRKRIVGLLAQYRTYGPWESLIRSTVRDVTWAFCGVNKRYMRWPRPWARAATSGGVIVCVLGPDGASRSTLTTEIVRWLIFKLDAIPVYMGRSAGQGFSSLGVLELLKSPEFSNSQSARPHKGASTIKPKHEWSSDLFLPRMIRLVWGVVLALEKKSKLKRAFRAANRGMIVVCDRYPQAQVFGFDDGPLLQDFKGSQMGILRAIASWELDVYRMSERFGPDLVIKLEAPVATTLAREPDTYEEEIKRRAKVIKKMSFPEQTKVVVIPAGLPWEEVLHRAKASVWSVI